ncbi:hypothetical protein BJV77DRAFT_1017913 [Russula vinacea]|nr:hypothetical protein BJV77DRAFT_1017913 [Russula vinacea]
MRKKIFAFSRTFGENIWLAFPPVTAMFSGMNVLLQAVKDVYADRDALVDIFERIDSFSQRLEFYIEAPLNRGMMDIITRTMVEVFCIMTIVAKEIRQDRMSKPLLYKYVTKFSKEAAWRVWHQGCADEAGQADARVGSNGHCASSEGHADY